MRIRAAAAACLASLVIGSAACDSEPGGPGALVATVSGVPLGGVVLQVVGRGIRGFEGLDNTQVYAAPLASNPNAYRVMLVNTIGSDLRFEIQVDDVGMEDPAMTVLSAAGIDNSTLLTAGIEARIER